MHIQQLEGRRLLAAAATTVTAEVFGDTLAIVGSGGDDLIEFERRGDRLAIHFESDVGVSFAVPGPSPQGVLELSAGELRNVKRVDVRIGEGNDTVILGRNLNLPARVDGGPGDDLIGGGDRDDLLIGGAGHDTLDGNDGLDTLYGNDRMFSGRIDFREEIGRTLPPQPDVLLGGRGDDFAGVDGSIFFGSGVEERMISGRFGTGLPGIYLAQGQIVQADGGLALRWDLMVPQVLDAELEPREFDGTLGIAFIAPDEAVTLGRDGSLPRKQISMQVPLPEDFAGDVVTYLEWNLPGETADEMDEALPPSHALIARFVPLEGEPLVGPDRRGTMPPPFEHAPRPPLSAWRAEDELFLDFYVTNASAPFDVDVTGIRQVDDTIFVSYLKTQPENGAHFPVVSTERFTVNLGSQANGSKRIILTNSDRIVGEQVLNFGPSFEGMRLSRNPNLVIP